MLPDRAPIRKPVHFDTPESRAEHHHIRTLAVLKVIDSLLEKAGPKGAPHGAWYSPVHAYIRDEFAVVAEARGIEPRRLELQSSQPAREVPLTQSDLEHATAALYEHHAMTPQERREAGLEDDPDGIPIVADIAACLAYLDEQDPKVPGYNVDNYIGAECTYSCNCPSVNPQHRRDNLWRPRTNGSVPEEYDPVGSDIGRVKQYRDHLRREQVGRGQQVRTALDKHVADPAVLDQATRGLPSARFTLQVDPAYVQLRRDKARERMGLERVGDESRREGVEGDYVGGMQALYKLEGQTPPSAKQILGPATERPNASAVDTTKLSFREIFKVGLRPWEQPQGEPVALTTEEAVAAVENLSPDLQLQGGSIVVSGPRQRDPNPSSPRVFFGEIPADTDRQTDVTDNPESYGRE